MTSANSEANSGVVRLNYGRDGQFSCEIDADRIQAICLPPPSNTVFREELRRMLQQPLDFPPLEQAVITDDRIVLALDHHTPQAAGIVAEIWRVLSKREVAPENVLILQQAPPSGTTLSDPRLELPEDLRQRVRWKTHDPEDESSNAYLAATAGGERIYLARDVIDADFIISIGDIAYDSVIGYRGTNSVFYPGLSSAEAIGRSLGQGHNELGPDDIRPLRQIIDETGWLLGIQFSVQVIAAAGGEVAYVLAGAHESVFRRGKQLLAENWRVELESRPEVVVAAIDADAAGHGWEQFGAAVATARNLVQRGGKIVILSELNPQLEPGFRMIAQCETPRDAIKPLRTESPADLNAATQLANAADWADIYFLSRLESDLVEDLFMVPLESEREVQRLLGIGGSCVFVGSAQNVYGTIRSD